MTSTVINLASEVLGVSADKINFLSIRSGDIHSVYCARAGNQQVFVKANSAEFAEVLKSEYQSLRYMHEIDLECYP